MSNTPFKMKGFSGFGGSPLKQETWQGLSKPSTTYGKKSKEPVINKPTGINEAIVDTVVDTIVPDSAAEALGYVTGGAIARNLKALGHRAYHYVKGLKTVKEITN